MVLVYKSLKVCFYCTILPLGLPIGLRIESCKGFLLDVKEVLEQRRKLVYENWALITNYWLWETMMSHYYMNNYFCKAESRDYNFNWLVVDYFYETINDDKNWVIVIDFLFCWNW